jgi:hypothetical protein
MATQYIPPDVIVSHMLASGSIKVGDVHVLKRSCASFRDAIDKNEQAIVDACFPVQISGIMLGSQLNIPRMAALLKAVLQGNAADVGSIASDRALFFGGPPGTFEQFDRTFMVLNHMTTLAETVVRAGKATWTLARWILYMCLIYLRSVVTDEGAIQAVAGDRRRAFADHMGEYCSRSIQYSMNPFDPKDDEEGNVHELVGLAYEVWLASDALKITPEP